MKYGILILLVALSFATIAQSGQEEIALFSAERVMKYRSKIDLTDQQTDFIKNLYNEHTASFNTLKWDLDDANLKLSELLMQTKVDSEAATAQMEKVLALESQIKQKRLSVYLSVKNQLTAEQQEQILDMPTGDAVFVSDLHDSDLSIKIRNKTGKNSNPIYFVKIDGELTEIDELKKIQPDGIESIEVIKGESAKALYGERGKNGVIIITLKKGRY